MAGEKDYRDTVFLPQTDFPMKASLPQREPEWLKRWQDMDLYGKLRAAAQGRETFILHDGPPYANGHIHLGTALNKIVKDFIIRSQQMLGKDAPYVPGWDCHGLPIEWKVEEKYRKAGKNKDDVPIHEFRQECREFAAHWIDVQRAEFQRLGGMGEWDNPYLTMTYEAEAAIAGELMKFLMNGGLYMGAKPVMWSVVEKTALAEAEVEYEDITSTQIDLAFEITESPIPELVGAHAVIWTTTPWTIPVNQAIAYGPDVDYVLVEAEGKRLLVAEALLDAVFSRHSRAGENPSGGAMDSRLRGSDALWRGKGADLAGTVARHPMHRKGGFFAKPRPFLPGEFVTTDQGTGLVHMAPDHGEDDFWLCKAHGIDPVFAVEDDGRYREDWLWLGGEGNVINKKFNAAEGPICSDLAATGQLLAASDDFNHSYPHSWRSKAKVIFRCTPQWFVGMEEGGLREKALKAIDETRFVPERGRNRLRGMVVDRPDWVLSRQRAWGVPITVFYNRKTKELVRDEAVNARIVRAFEDEGADAWFAHDTAFFLGNDYNPDDYEKVTDVLDVWFDSGSTHAFVLESGKWPDLSSPATLYFEGSDQHRGWFQSSLLESVGTRGRAPYKEVLTHGFIVDANGRKMSKSLGNVVDPLKIVEQYGADILRLWAAAIDFTEDARFGDEILKGQVDAYRKLRNTLRFLLGNLGSYTDDDHVPAFEMPELERWVLHRLSELDAVIRQAANDYDFHRIYSALYNFCVIDLSAFYLDIRKDALYCDARSSLRRRSAMTVLDILHRCLCTWLAPILCFTAEDAWQARFPSKDDSVHLQLFPEIPEDWRDEVLAAKWRTVRAVRRVATGALEVERREKRIGSSLAAHPAIHVADPDMHTIMQTVDIPELVITSGAELVLGDGPGDAFRLDDVHGVAVVPGEAQGQKCERCWQILPEVRDHGDGGHTCDRCASALDEMEKAAG